MQEVKGWAIVNSENKLFRVYPDEESAKKELDRLDHFGTYGYFICLCEVRRIKTLLADEIDKRK